MPETIEVDDYSFDKKVLGSKKVFLVDFWAPWCGPCKMLGPVIEELAKEIEDIAGVAKMNVDENPVIPGRYKVMSIPTMLIFKNGKIIDQMVGAQPKDTIIKRLKSAIGG